MRYKYEIQVIGQKKYIKAVHLISEKEEPTGEYEFSRALKNNLLDENGKFQWIIRENPDYKPETSHIDDRYLIEHDPILPTAEEIEAERRAKIKRQLQTELPELILQNKDNPENLAKVLCDRAKQIEAGTKR